MNHQEYQEFSRLFAYLANKPPTLLQIQSYVEGIKKLQLHITEKKEKEIVAYLRNNPSMIAVIDTGISLYYKNSILHKRILLVAALAECDKRNSCLFLNKKQLLFPLFHLFFIGIQAVFLAIFAFILFQYKQWK